MLETPSETFERAKTMYQYLTKDRGYNRFLIDEIDEEILKKLKESIKANNKLETVKIYKKMHANIEDIRAKHCENTEPYKSNFRAIAKDLYIEIKDEWLFTNSDIRFLYHLLRRISSSNYNELSLWLERNSFIISTYTDIEIDYQEFYNDVIPIEAILAYAIVLINEYRNLN